MKLSLPRLLLLCLAGALVSPFGDYSHVVTGTTEYLTHNVPFIWESPFWFPVMVGLATAAIAEFRLQIAAPRMDVGLRDGAAGIAAVMGTYALTALLHGAPLVPATMLIVALGVLSWWALGDAPAVLCGIAAAFGGTAVEAALVAGGVFRYADDINVLFGVAPWLPALYFAFGVVAALLGEIAAFPDRTSR